MSLDIDGCTSRNDALVWEALVYLTEILLDKMY